MTVFRFPASLLALATVLAISPVAVAQVATAPRATPDADALADAMRRLATNPRDIDALVTAGELSVRLGDLSGAASLFARADKVDPMNARVKAGMGRVLVQEERPGAALRYFDQAVGYGLNPRAFAGDRAFAYDLIGEQERAQRDYRVAMQSDSSDELVRRYALSLGISGKREEAFALLDPLLRKQDRSAWRARAFILAMGGDQAGADKIATSMMPGFASGLRPFFQKLPSLPAADRAFAVHFGEVRPTPDRLADARLVPALTPLAPEAGVQVAAATPVRVPAVTATEDRRTTRQRDRDARGARNRGATQVAPVVTAAPRAVQTVQALPPQMVTAQQPVAAQPGPTRAPVVVAVPSTATQLAANAVRSSVGGDGAAIGVRALQPASAVPPVVAPIATGVVSAPAATGVVASTTPAVPATGVAATPVVQPLPAQVATQVAPASAVPAPVAVASTAAPPALAMVQAVPPEDPPQRATPATRTARLPRPPRSVNDSILARIVAGIEIPAAELASAPVAEPRTRAGRRAAAAAAKLEAAQTEAAAPEVVPRTRAGRRAAAAAKLEAEAATTDGAAVPRTRAGRRAAAVAAAKLEAETTQADAPEKPVDRATVRKAAAAKALADKKAAEKKLADKAAADEKLAAKKAARSEPSRVWVQVAGGANESDLPKAWNAVKAKTPALAGKSAYSTPLRATNRVVTGPFKTEAEARAFVNTLAKQGLSAFPFTSEAGQKVTRLPGK